MIAKEMGLSADEVRKTRLSALLHDVGKIGVDDRIIRKPTALTDEEFELMKAHPSKGAAIMEAIPQLADIIPGMKWHHEKWEGGGYPDGLKGEQIPVQARIVAVADAFDAMTTTRPYQKAMEVTYVLERLREMSHKRFHYDAVEALVRLLHQGRAGPARASRRGGRSVGLPGRPAPGDRDGGLMRRLERPVALARALALAAILVATGGCHRLTKPKTSSELLLTERMAQVLLRDNQPVDAERAFREVLKYDSKNAEALDGLGNALIMQGRYKEAMTYLDKAVSLEPDERIVPQQPGRGAHGAGRVQGGR